MGKPLKSMNFLGHELDIPQAGAGGMSEDEVKELVEQQLKTAQESGVFDGADGKSAHAYAAEAGYQGTAEQFSIDLASIGDVEAALDQIIAIQEGYIEEGSA